jgi:hypothetical protein
MAVTDGMPRSLVVELEWRREDSKSYRFRIVLGLLYKTKVRVIMMGIVCLPISVKFDE